MLLPTFHCLSIIVAWMSRGPLLHSVQILSTFKRSLAVKAEELLHIEEGGWGWRGRWRRVGKKINRQNFSIITQDTDSIFKTRTVS